MSTLQCEKWNLPLPFKWLTGVPLSDCATGLEFNHLILISVRKGYPSRWPGAISWKSLLEPFSLPLGDRQLLLGEVVGKPKSGLRLHWKSISQMTVLRMVGKKCLLCFGNRCFQQREQEAGAFPVCHSAGLNAFCQICLQTLLNSPASSDENYRVAPRHFTG